jgi:SAM-dependent methyltransferase
MGAKGEWFADFFDATYGKILAGTFDDARTLEQARAAKRLLRVRKPMRVLDIACGIGRLTIPLAGMGLSMTGVDLVAGYVRRARRAARRRGLDVRFLCRDMREIDFDGEFDAALSYFTSIGYFGNEENLRFCRKALAALKPGGRFLIETINRSWLLAHFRPRGEQTASGIRVTSRNRYDEATRRVESDWTFHLPAGRQRRHISLRVYNSAEMRAMLRAAGFRGIRFHASPPVGRFSRHSKRLIAVAERPR